MIEFPRKEQEYSVPYHSLSESLQRTIFLKAAIESNNKCVLLFDEPDCPPSLTRQIIRAMIRKRSKPIFFDF